MFKSAGLNHNHLITAVNHPSNNICKWRVGSPRVGEGGVGGGSTTGGASGNEVKIEGVKK